MDAVYLGFYFVGRGGSAALSSARLDARRRREAELKIGEDREDSRRDPQGCTVNTGRKRPPCRRLRADGCWFFCVLSC